MSDLFFWTRLMQTALCTAVVCACVCVCTHVCVCVSAPVEPCCVSYRRQLSTEHVCKGVAYLIQWEWLAWRIYQKKFSSFHMWPAEYLFIDLFIYSLFGSPLLGSTHNHTHNTYCITSLNRTPSRQAKIKRNTKHHNMSNCPPLWLYRKKKHYTDLSPLSLLNISVFIY